MTLQWINLTCFVVICCTCHLGQVLVCSLAAGEGEYLILNFREKNNALAEEDFIKNIARFLTNALWIESKL